MLFIDLDETLVRTRLLGSLSRRNDVVADKKADFLVRVGGGIYDVYVRPDIYRLWWSNLPFVVFSAGDRDYVRAIVRKLRDKSKLNIRGWLHRYDMADVGPSDPLTEDDAVLIDERHHSDPIVRYKLARLPNGVHLRIDPWDANELTRRLELRRAPTSMELRRIIKMSREILGIKETRVSKMLKADLSKAFDQQP